MRCTRPDAVSEQPSPASSRSIARCRWLKAALLVAVCALLSTSRQPAEGAEGPSPGSHAEAAAGDAIPAEATLSGAAFSEGGLLSSFHRERHRLEDVGITFGLNEQSEVWANLTGGGRQGLSYNGLTTARLDVDLDKAVGWTGAKFHFAGYDIHAHGPTRSLVGNQQVVSNIEATPSVKLYHLWLEQILLGDRLSIRLGQEGANDEMMTTAYGGLYLNSSFGYPGMPAAVLPSGGPNYPIATPFLRAQLKASDSVTLVGAIFNGDPAPAGAGDPQIRDRNGTAFRLDDHALIFGELRYSPDAASDNLPTTYKLGGWYASNHFADQRHDNTGALLASPASSGRARDHVGDYALYGIIDQMVWRRAGTKDQGVGVFLQVMGGPSDRNLSNLFIESGMNWRAPFPDRPDDVAGLAFSYLGISPAARGFSRDLVAFGRATSPYSGNETVLEATYTAPVTAWLTLQPDLQLVINPGAGIPGTFGRAPLADAVVIGVRATIRL
jgi:porin